LSAFYKPELFEKKFAIYHLDYLFRYFKEDIYFTILPDIFSMELKDENFSNTDLLFGIIKGDRFEQDYITYSYDINNRKILRKEINDLIESDYGDISLLESRFYPKLIEFIFSFYKNADILKQNSQNKEMVLKNMKKIANLHKQSYINFIIDFDNEIKYEYGL
jgi:hypothetical protein